ncbi:SdpI family protein [Dietzia sp. CH92]|uniref:SdpI family protein n=1 Tax=Dietzia sp. CH92 TaxID=3051823 RepID=UPI0028D4FF6C|nr:SdpI family protein [Dietzia sp. CH92]
MNAVLVVVVVLLVGLALIIGGTGAAALAGKLPGNGVLGVRTPETRRSPDAWALANRAAGPAFLGSGLVLLLGAIALGLIGGWVGGLVVVVALLASLALLSMAGLAGARAAAIWAATQDDDQGGCGCGPDGCGGHSGTAGATTDASTCAPTGDASCSPADAAGADDPAADCGVTGGCGSCALQGMCESETATR